jgi:hypothetical protein
MRASPLQLFINEHICSPHMELAILVVSRAPGSHLRIHHDLLLQITALAM